MQWFMQDHTELMQNIYRPGRGPGGHYLMSLLNDNNLRRVLHRMLDENEFLSPYGIRSLSRHYAEHTYVLNMDGQQFSISYLPAESNTGMFGGNSNWRGPIWLPMNDLIIRALLQLHLYYQDSFTVECPTGSGKQMNLYQVSKEIYQRLLGIFTRSPNGLRPVYGGVTKFQTDPHWKDNILFYEYFHGDNGAGIGASHQTGWTGTIARLIQIFSIWGDSPLAFGKSIRSRVAPLRKSK
jgi:hypothetical protein